MNAGPSDAINPIDIDPSIRFTSIGGLKEHIQCLREMIIFPLMYPELFKKFNTRPAKGVLFHGPPGTGKTLLARALANECSLVGGRRVSFFMRKGADVMNKYYGESERNLRMLFQMARKRKPSIIFFDEIDALAPARKPTQDSTHSSVVATLLSEMDGLCDRGNVVVIGATNRPDAMDPAIRRAGRLDRELYFPPPEMEARRDILAIYTKDWDPGLSNETLEQIAKLTVGFLGSDIKSLCSEAVLKAVKRVYPQIYESDVKLLINAQNVDVTTEDLLAAMEEIVPTGARYAPPAAKALPHHTIPLLQDQVDSAMALLNKTFVVKSTKSKCSKVESSTVPSVFLVTGECAEDLIAPAMLARMEPCFVRELSVPVLHAAHVLTPEHAVISLFSECRRAGRSCVIFIRDLLAVWDALERKKAAQVLVQLWRMGSVGENTLLLAAFNGSYEVLPKKLKEMFPAYKNCIYTVRKPTPGEVSSFLNPVIKELPLVPPVAFKPVVLPALPKAPTGCRETEEDMVRRIFREYDYLRELRTKLKSICRGLSGDRRYQKFSTAFRYEDKLPEYYEVIKHPMDFATIFYKIENKQYYCAKEFLDDIDLICANTLLYQKLKPEKRFRNEAVQLHTDAYNMVSEEIDPQLELECQLIARRKREDDDYLPEPNNYSDDFYMSKLGSNEHDHAPFNDVPKADHQANSRKRQKKILKGVEAKRPRYSPKRPRAIRSQNKSNTEHNRAEPRSSDNPEHPPVDTQPSDSSPNEIIINCEELDAIANNYLAPLCSIGLEALIDLHSQLSKTVYAYSNTENRTSLPQELEVIVNRYIEHASTE